MIFRVELTDNCFGRLIKEFGLKARKREVRVEFDGERIQALGNKVMIAGVDLVN